MEDLGTNLRSLRIQRNLTLEQLSRKAKISKSQLSQIERNSSVPTVTRLARIASALGVELDHLVASPTQSGEAGRSADAKAHSADIAVVRRDQRRKVIMPWGAWSEVLCPDLRHQIEFLYLHYPVGATAGQLYTHAGEECGLVLEGTFRGIFGDREVVLEAGDSVYYDSSIPHYWENAGDVDVRAIWAITPPSF
jgi:transcriptional regulator with XRE-family HTH domain